MVKSTKCSICKKKVGLMIMTCKCGTKTCISHMYPSLHNCKRDLKAEAKNILIKNNPEIVADKIDNRLQSN